MQGAVEQVEPVGAQGLLATGTDGASLRDLVAQRVAAHRSRRAGAEALEAAREAALRMERDAMAREGRRGAAKVRDAVRARYEQTQSYHEFLAAEAERALQQAKAEAEVAARNAKAIAEAQMQLLEELAEQKTAWPEDHTFQPASDKFQAVEEICHLDRSSEASTQYRHLDRSGREADAKRRDPQFASPADDSPVLSIVESAQPTTPSSRPERTALSSAQRRDPRIPETHSGNLFDPEPVPAPHTEISSGGLTVRLYEDLAPARKPTGLKENERHPRPYADESAEELEELEQEIAFRRAPEFINHILEAVPIPANLIEFPRQLIASRKARPRLAEGPLREDTPPEPQLRIFEVEPEQISIEPAAPEETAVYGPQWGPDWQGLVLDSGPADQPAAAAEEAARNRAAQPPDIAPIQRRLMAIAVDGCCVGAALVTFCTVVAYISGPGLQALSKPMLAGAGVIVFAAAYLIYQALFFTFAEATPGMRYARIGLCTFTEENPSRKAMRRRILATLLAACPLGIGLLWVCMDDDRLGWHDRISGMYQRSY